MRKSLFIILCFYCFVAVSQNITVDSQTYTPQELIEDILIDSDCISNIQVTNVVGGNFNNTDQSYGFFNAIGTTFPFQTGIVLTTGRLNNVPGPNTSLSDDNAPNWNGDSDLENVLQETNTTNATIIEFDFTSVANQISFRYIFASEEYQEGNPNTCNFSDLFGFLIRPANATNYENIALVPNTQTPVKVTTVHPDIPGGCGPINEVYFESFNGSMSPINFNGQTKVLTATAQTMPNQNYHVKLVIADEQNFRFDSAVFLEAGSFELNTNLGQDRLLANNNPVCENDTILLNAFQPGMTTYKWFRNNVELITETNATYQVTQAGTYTIEITLDNSCISYGEIVIEYAPNPTIINTTLFECDINQDGLTTYNLFDSVNNITMNNSDLIVTDFYSNMMDAQMEVNAIVNPNNFNNTSILQTVYTSVMSQNTGCKAIAEIILDISPNTFIIQNYEVCDDDIVDGFTSFNLDDIRTAIEPTVPTNSTISFYMTIEDAFTETNVIDGNFENTVQDSQTIFVKITTNTNQCYDISELILDVLFTPQLLPDESVLYCLNSFPDTITLIGGLTNDLPSNHYYQWFFNGTDTGINTSFIDINTTGTYTVIVTDPNGCSNTRDITVFSSSDPTIDNISFTELTANNTATVSVSGEGNYEFAIDNEFDFYQDDSTFFNIAPGFHTIFIRDKNGCGKASIDFSILGFPQYFTPNGDDINEIWKPYGTSEEFNNDLKVLIFNRHGKLLAEVDPVEGWNGSYKGFILPSSDYWYIVNHPNGKQYKGHFALVR